MKKENKKRKTTWVGRAVMAFFLIEIVFAACIFFQEIYPKSWTHFRSYAQFIKVADWTPYDQTLPDSAHDMRYYYYEGYFSDMSGYHAAFSAEDYEIKKERLVEKHIGTSADDTNSSEKNYLDREQIKEARVDFLDKLLPEDKDDGQFYYIAYFTQIEPGGIYDYFAALGNDSTYEIIELSCRICD